MPISPFRRSSPIFTGLAFVTAMALTACSKPEPAQEPVRSVKVLAVGLDEIRTGHEFAGEVRPRVESKLGFRVAGKITQRQVEMGQRVKAGQVLARLDPRDYQLAADAAHAQVAAASTNRDLAAADFKRYSLLKDQNFISGAELERRETALKAAQAQLDQAKAQLAAQGNQAGYANLVADVSGVVTAVEAEAGQVVTAGMTVVRIAQDGAREVVFSVPEDQVAAIRPGSDVTVRVWTNASTLDGKVREVAASADPVTRTYPVKVSLDPRSAPPLGSTVHVFPNPSGRAGTPAIKLPTSALRQEGQGTAVWVLDTSTMTVRSQPVQIASADGNEAVIAGGLQPGMLVVTAGVHVLSPGQKVTIYQERGAQPAASVPQASEHAGAAMGAARAMSPPAAR